MYFSIRLYALSKLRIEPFRFEMREETLDGGIVITIASARHTDLGANLGQHVVVKMRRVRGSTVTVNDHARHVFSFAKSFLKRTLHQFFVGGEIEPSFPNPVLREVGHPFLVGFVGLEVLLQYVFRHEPSGVRCIRVTRLSTYLRSETQRLHEPKDFLMIHPDPLVLPEKKLKLAIAVNAVVFLVNLTHQPFIYAVFVDFLPTQPRVITAFGDAKPLAKPSDLSLFVHLLDERISRFCFPSLQMGKHFFNSSFSRFKA